MAKETQVYRVSQKLVETWKEKFSAEDRAQFDANVEQETVYRIPKEMARAWRKKFAEEPETNGEELL